MTEGYSLVAEQDAEHLVVLCFEGVVHGRARFVGEVRVRASEEQDVGDARLFYRSAQHQHVLAVVEAVRVCSAVQQEDRGVFVAEEQRSGEWGLVRGLYLIFEVSRFEVRLEQFVRAGFFEEVFEELGLRLLDQEVQRVLLCFRLEEIGVEVFLKNQISRFFVVSAFEEFSQTHNGLLIRE